MAEQSVLLYAHRLAKPTATGIGRYVVELTRALAARRDPWSYDLCSTREREQASWTPPSVAVRIVPGPRPAAHLAWCVARHPRVERLVGGFELLHVLSPSLPVPTRRPAVWTVHDLMPLTNPEWFEPLERWMFRRAIRQMVDSAAAIIADSEHVRTQVQQRLGVDAARVVTVHLAVSDAFRVSAQMPGDDVLERYGVRRGRYVITLGNVEERKNLVMLVQAFAAARAAVSDVILVIAGPERAGAAAVRAEVERLRLADAVRFTGYVAGDELPTLVSAAAALLHPSADEGFGFTPLEAMAAGVPTAVSNAGSLPEIVGDAAPMLDPSDVDAWTSAIVALVEDAGWRAQLIDAGRTRARWFSWDRTAAATAAVYERCIG